MEKYQIYLKIDERGVNFIAHKSTDKSPFSVYDCIPFCECELEDKDLQPYGGTANTEFIVNPRLFLDALANAIVNNELKI